MKRLAALLLALACCVSPVFASAAGFTMDVAAETDGEKLVHGYDQDTKQHVWIQFASYPYEADGTVRPLLWRVLTTENGYAWLLCEHILEFYQFHNIREEIYVWNQNSLYTQMNTEMKDKMFTAEELSVVRHSDEWGWLYILDTGEYMTPKYGFRKIYMHPQEERECAATPYALADENSYVNPNGNSTYWSRTRRHYNALVYILGFDGHISVSGCTRYNGVRPCCWVDLTRLDNATGSGTKDDPYIFEIVR